MKKHNHLKTLFQAGIIVACGALSGCLDAKDTMGGITTDISAYDNTVRKWVTPAPVRAEDGGFPSPFSVGLFWVEGSDNIHLTLQEDGIVGINSVGINIDGKLHELQRPDTLTDFETSGEFSHSKKNFKMSVDIAKKMVSGKKVIIQSRTNDGYHDGDFTASCDWELGFGNKGACLAFRDFLEEHIQ